MDDIEARVVKLLGDDNRLKRLLALEKERRKVPENSLVFVGIANVAEHWWCTEQAVLESRANEQDFFASYLSDRINYSYQLGMISKLPRQYQSLLEIGEDITLADVTALLKKEKMERTRTNDDDVIVRYVPSPDDDPKMRGQLMEICHAEQYPTIRWNFSWDKYVVVGRPDGITDQFVYEYKTTGSRFLLSFRKPVALAQADLYGFFFKRPKKRVQIWVEESNTTETFEEAINCRNAEETLASFAQVDAGKPAILPKPWKCRVCDFRSTCPISQAD